MSENLPQSNQSEEVDLGQLFKLIGNAFDRFFKFITSIFNKLFLAFVWIVFFIKKHFIKFIIAGIIGYGYGLFMKKTRAPVYKSHITVKQNYPTGENLYNTIAYYNELVKQNDRSTLESVLEMSPNEASSILNFQIESVISENEKLKEYDSYIKTLDSTLASTVEYQSFLENDEDYNHEYQQITIKAKERNSFNLVFNNIISNINSNEYFIREQKKDLDELTSQENYIKEALTKSDSLQSTYKRVLEKSFDNKKGSEIGITFEGANDKEKTKEFELYKSDLELRKELVEIAREKANKANILEIISSKQDSGSIDDKVEVFNISISPKIFYAFILTTLTFLILLSLSFIKYLDRYKDKI